MLYRKIKRTWSNGYANNTYQIKKVFPELKKLSSEEMVDRFIELGMDFYREEKEPVNVLIRFTLPLAIIMMVIMLVGLPITFLITGKWGYSLNDKNVLLNWFRMLRLQ